MKRAIPVLFAVLTLAALGQACWHYAHLPPRVATHFSLDGQPNGWMSREAQLGWNLGLVVFIAGLLEGIARAQQRLPVGLINLPHREYWLAPERRDATRTWIANLVRLSGCGVLGLFLGLFHQVYRANLDRQPLAFPTAGIAIGTALALAGLVGACLRRFSRPSAS